MSPPRVFIFLFLPMLLAGIAFAGNDSTTGGNITGLDVSLPQNTSSWHGVVGQASPSPAVPFTINATPGNLSDVVISTGSGSFPFGVSGSIFFLFSNSSSPITSLSPGNLSLLNEFIGPYGDNATATFTFNTTFTMPGFTVPSVPTAYTLAPNPTSFRVGYMQDQDGNIVIAAEVVDQNAGFNGSLFDFQFMLPARNGTSVPYYLTVLIKGNIPPPPPPPSPSPPLNVSVEVQPPPIVLPPANVFLLEYPILREMSPGDSVLLFPMLENPGPDVLQVDVIPSGSGAALASGVTVFLPPNKPVSLVIPVQVPQNASVGYYGLSLVYSLNGSNVSHPLIIRVVPYRTAGLVTYREISIAQHQNNSVMRLDAVNKGTQPIGHGAVFEQVPPAFDLRGISFLVTPMVTDSSLIRWDVANLLPNETRALSYVLSGIPDDLKVFTFWPSAQALVIEPDFYRDVSIGGFEAPDIGPGEKGDYVIKLFNAGPSQEAVAVKITGAEGWNVEPDSFSVSIPPRAASEVRFSITAPANAPDPVYTFTVHLTYGGIEDQKTLPVPINHEKLVTLPQSPLRDQLLAWLVTNAYLLALVAIASVAVSLALHRGYLELRKPRYSKKRVESMTELQKLFGDDKKRE